MNLGGNWYQNSLLLILPKREGNSPFLQENTDKREENFFGGMVS